MHFRSPSPWLALAAACCFGCQKAAETTTVEAHDATAVISDSPSAITLVTLKLPNMT